MDTHATSSLQFVCLPRPALTAVAGATVVFQDLLDVIVSDDNAQKLVVRLRILNEEGGSKEESDEPPVNDETMKKLDQSYLRDLKLQGVQKIRKVFLREADRITPDPKAPTGYKKEKEWMLDTEGVNLIQVGSSRRHAA